LNTNLKTNYTQNLPKYTDLVETLIEPNPKNLSRHLNKTLNDHRGTKLKGRTIDTATALPTRTRVSENLSDPCHGRLASQ